MSNSSIRRSVSTQQQNRSRPGKHWAPPIARRRPRTRVGRAVRRLLGAWWLLLFGAGGVIAAACTTPAHADVSVEAAAYESANSDVICDILALDPSVATVEDVVTAMFRDGLTPVQAGQVLPIAVLVNCPAFEYLIDAYAAKWAPEAVGAGTAAATGISRVLR